MEAQIFAWIIYIAVALWVASVQVKVRQIGGWAYFWCLLLGPLWGWIAIALTCKRRPKPEVVQ